MERAEAIHGAAYLGENPKATTPSNPPAAATTTIPKRPRATLTSPTIGIIYGLLLGLKRALRPLLASNNWYSVRDCVRDGHGFQFFVHNAEHSMGAGAKWNGANDRINTTNDPDGIPRHTYRLNVSIDGTPRKSYRIKVVY